MAVLLTHALTPPTCCASQYLVPFCKPKSANRPNLQCFNPTVFYIVTMSNSRRKFKKKFSFTVHRKTCTPKTRKCYINKWKDILCSWIGRYNIVKVSIVSKQVYKFNAITIKIPKMFFTNEEKCILKFMWKLKGRRVSKTILAMNHRVGGLMAPVVLKSSPCPSV